jgi:hypothetical protein
LSGKTCRPEKGCRTGSLRERLTAWRTAHSIPPGEAERIPALVNLAVSECLRRTRALVELPEGIDVDCALTPGPFRGLHYWGGLRGTVFLDPALPFTTADLLYVVAHEAFPGHIAEFLLKERHLADRPELAVRFKPAPEYAVSYTKKPQPTKIQG